MARFAAVQAELRSGLVKLLKLLPFHTIVLGLVTVAASEDLGMGVEIAAQGFYNRTGPALTDRLTVYPDHWHYRLARGRDKCFAGRMGLLDREGTLLETQALRRDDVEHDRARNPRKDVVSQLVRD